MSLPTGWVIYQVKSSQASVPSWSHKGLLLARVHRSHPRCLPVAWEAFGEKTGTHACRTAVGPPQTPAALIHTHASASIATTTLPHTHIAPTDCIAHNTTMHPPLPDTGFTSCTPILHESLSPCARAHATALGGEQEPGRRKRGGNEVEAGRWRRVASPVLRARYGKTILLNRKSLAHRGGEARERPGF